MNKVPLSGEASTFKLSLGVSPPPPPPGHVAEAYREQLEQLGLETKLSDFRRAKNSYTTAPKNYNPHLKSWQKAVNKNTEGR